MAIAIGMWETGQWDAAAGRWGQGAARVFADAKTASGQDLAMCGAILAHSRDLAREVLAGLSLRATYDKVKAEQAEAAATAAALDTLRDLAPDAVGAVVVEDKPRLRERLDLGNRGRFSTVRAVIPSPVVA